MTSFAETVPQVDPRVEFWSGAGARWPRNGHRHIFAGHVVHRAGQLLYDKNWDGTEPETALVQPLPARLDAATRADEVAWSIHILSRCYPPYAERLALALSEGQPAPLPEPDEWQFAVGVSSQISNETYAAFDRYRKVIDLLVSLLESGTLRAALRPFYLGEPEPLPAGAWYNEIYFVWFATCRIDTNNPFSGRPARGLGHWIVFEAESFQDWERHVKRLRVQNCEAAAENAMAPPSSMATEEPIVDDAPVDVPSEGAKPAVAECSSSQETAVVDRAEAASPACQSKVVNRRKPGAKDKYPWHDGPFEEEVVAIMTGDSRPSSLHHLARIMLEWCAMAWSNEPSLTQMRLRLADILSRRNLTFTQ